MSSRVNRIVRPLGLAILAILAIASVAGASSPTPTSFNARDFVWREYKSCYEMVPTGKKIEAYAPNTNQHDWENDNGEACRITYNQDGFSSTIPEFSRWWITAMASSPGFSRVISNGEALCCFSKRVDIEFDDRQPGYYYKHRPPKASVNSVEDAYAAFGGCSHYWNAWIVETPNRLEQAFVFSAPKKGAPGCRIPLLIVPAGFVAIWRGETYYPGAALMDIRYVEMYHDGTYWRMTH